MFVCWSIGWQVGQSLTILLRLLATTCQLFVGQVCCLLPLVLLATTFFRFGLLLVAICFMVVFIFMLRVPYLSVQSCPDALLLLETIFHFNIKKQLQSFLEHKVNGQRESFTSERKIIAKSDRHDRWISDQSQGQTREPQTQNYWSISRYIHTDIPCQRYRRLQGRNCAVDNSFCEYLQSHQIFIHILCIIIGSETSL